MRRPRPTRVRIPALGETLMRSLFIGSGGAVETARAAGADRRDARRRWAWDCSSSTSSTAWSSPAAQAGRALLEKYGDLLR